LVDVRGLGSILDACLTAADRRTAGLGSRDGGVDVPAAERRRSEPRFVRKSANRKIVRDALEVAGDVHVRLASAVTLHVPGQADARGQRPVELVFARGEGCGNECPSPEDVLSKRK